MDTFCGTGRPTSRFKFQLGHVFSDMDTAKKSWEGKTPEERRFNWATSFQTWILAGSIDRPKAYPPVSIGPRLFRHGYADDILVSAAVAMFQLGHVFSDMDTLDTSRFISFGDIPFQLGHVFSDMDTLDDIDRARNTLGFNWATSFQTWIRRYKRLSKG